MKKTREQKKTVITYCIILILGMLFYLFCGEWISIQDDSSAYLAEKRGEGVLPGYPVFLAFFRNILTEQYFLHGVVVVQSLLAVMCTFLFVLVLKKQFNLRNVEVIFLYVLSMMPFAIYLPEVGITHQIMTEGITYAIFYLYFIMVIKAVWTHKYIWYAGSLLIAFLLGLIRSQMLFLQVVCVLVLLWIILNRGRSGLAVQIARGVLAVCVGVILALGSYKGIYAVVRLDIYSGATVNASVEEVKQEENLDKTVTEGEKEKEKENNNVTLRKETSQFDTVIISRGLYEADREDEELFEDEVTRAIFRRAYELADEAGHRYVYARPGLYMWKDLVHDRMRVYVVQAMEEYNAVNPGQINDPDKITRELGIKILLKHFDRYLYHTMRLMIPSFIAAIFFQIEPIYLLCHFIALVLYLAAIVGTVMIYKSSRDRKAAEIMGAILCIIFIMATVINLVFVGLQRYMVYGMGIFWCSAYLVLSRRIKDGKETKKACSD